jgi:hypothetical protein
VGNTLRWKNIIAGLKKENRKFFSPLHALQSFTGIAWSSRKFDGGVVKTSF